MRDDDGWGGTLPEAADAGLFAVFTSAGEAEPDIVYRIDTGGDMQAALASAYEWAQLEGGGTVEIVADGDIVAQLQVAQDPDDPGFFEDGWSDIRAALLEEAGDYLYDDEDHYPGEG